MVILLSVNRLDFSGLLTVFRPVDEEYKWAVNKHYVA